MTILNGVGSIIQSNDKLLYTIGAILCIVFILWGNMKGVPKDD